MMFYVFSETRNEVKERCLNFVLFHEEDLRTCHVIGKKSSVCPLEDFSHPKAPLDFFCRARHLLTSQVILGKGAEFPNVCQLVSLLFSAHTHLSSFDTSSNLHTFSLKSQQAAPDCNIYYQLPSPFQKVRTHSFGKRQQTQQTFLDAVGLTSFFFFHEDVYPWVI